MSLIRFSWVAVFFFFFFLNCLKMHDKLFKQGNFRGGVGEGEG